MSIARLSARSSLRQRTTRRYASGAAGPVEALFDAYTAAFIASPPAMGISYATTIIGLAVALKLSVSMPLSLWARGRQDRLQRLALPELRQYMSARAPSIKTESQRLRRTFDQYKKAVTADVRESNFLHPRTQFAKKRRELLRSHRCTLLPTIAVPFVVNSVAFLGTTLMIRQACFASSTESIGDLSDMIASGRGGALLTQPNMDLLNLASGVDPLGPLAAESFAWCTSLVATDPTMMLPLAVGLASFANTELNAQARQQTMKASLPEPVSNDFRPDATATKSAASTRRSPTYRRSASTIAASGKTPPPTEVVVSTASKTISNVLRSFSVAFIVIAVNAPSAIVIYWLASHTINILSTVLLRSLDRRHVQQ